jgi:alpha-glucosidase
MKESTQYGLHNRLQANAAYQESANTFIIKLETQVKHYLAAYKFNQVYLRCRFLDQQNIQLTYVFKLKDLNQIPERNFSEYNLSETSKDEANESSLQLNAAIDNEIKHAKQRFSEIKQLYSEIKESQDLSQCLYNSTGDLNKALSNLTLSDLENSFEIKSSKLKIQIQKAPLKLIVYKILPDQHEVLAYEELAGAGYYSKSLNEANKTYKNQLVSYITYKSEPKIYGLADKTGKLNRFGRRFKQKPTDALGYNSRITDPLYKDIPFFIAKSPETNFGLFFDNSHPKFFDFGVETKPIPYIHYSAEAGYHNTYLFFEDSVADISRKYISLTGKPVLAPKFSFGYLGSGMYYTDALNSADLIQDFKERNHKAQTPISAFHLSSGYTLDEQDKRMQFVWSKKRFSNPENFHQALQVPVCVNLKPVLLLEHPFYNEAQKLELFIKDDTGTTLVVDYWGGPGSYLNFNKPAAQSWWQHKIETYLLAYGVRGIWNDNNEYEIFEGHELLNTQGTALLANLMCLVSVKASLNSKPNLRPWILSRSAFSGAQAHAQSWTGDNHSSYEALKYDNTIVSSMGLTGLIHSGADIGGFWGDIPTAELLMRWVQAGIFTPRFCIHSYKEQATETMMHAQKHPKFFKVIQKFIKLRAELLPYFYQASFKACIDGTPIQRPLVYDFESDQQTHEESFSFMCGASLLVAPVAQDLDTNTFINLKNQAPDDLQSNRKKISSKNELLELEYHSNSFQDHYENPTPEAKLKPKVSKNNIKQVYLPQLPPNQKWLHFFTYEEYQPDTFINIQLDHESIPVFIKSGSFIPKVNFNDPQELILELYLTEADFKQQSFNSAHPVNTDKTLRLDYLLYDDDGDSNDYLNGNYCFYSFSFELSLVGNTVKILKSERTRVGNYPGSYQKFSYYLIFNRARTLIS